MFKLTTSSIGNWYQAFCQNILTPASSFCLATTTFITAIAFSHYNHQQTALFLLMLGLYFISIGIWSAIEKENNR